MKVTKTEEEFVKDGAEKITDKDIDKVVVKSEDIKKKFTKLGPLQRFVEDAKLLLALVQDYRLGRYRQVPFGTVAAIVFTLLYVFNPLDLVPDVLPIIGQIDDAAVFSGCLLLIEQDLHKYAKWKEDQPKLS